MSTHYDFIVIGGGSGGSACARRAAGYGITIVAGPRRILDRAYSDEQNIT